MVKSLTSILAKLEKINLPMFSYPTEVTYNIIGARVICLFIDDCYGMFYDIQATKGASSLGLWKTPSEIRSAPNIDQYTF